MKKKSKVSIPESQIVNLCIRWLWLNRCFVWRNNSGAYKPERSNRFIRFGYPGSADIIGVTESGRFISVECKSATGKLSDHQKHFGDRVLENDGIYIVARGIEDLEKYKSQITSKL